MTKTKLILIILLFLAGLIGFRFLWLSVHPHPINPSFREGELDLRHQKLPEDRLVSLDGPWEFYPNSLIFPEIENSKSYERQKHYIQVPGKWNKLLKNPDKPAHGYGSYRLRILVDRNPKQSYGITISGVQTSSKLFVNGELLGNSGSPAARKELFTARVAPYTVYFTTDRNEIEIIIHAANFSFAQRGGIIKPVLLGSADAINNERLYSIILQLIVCVVLLLHGLYAGILYLIGPRQKVLLYFFLMVIFAIISLLMDNDRLLLLWIPFSLEWFMKILLISYVATFSFLLLAAKHMLFEGIKLKSVYVLLSLSGIYNLLILAGSVTGYFEYYMLFYGPVIFTLAIGVTLLILKSVLLKFDGSVFLLLAIIAIFNNTLWGLFKNRGWSDTTFYPFDMIVAFLGLAAFWFKRYSWNKEQTLQLTESLKRTLKQKDDFLANTSHELRNPLHGMINIAETVLSTERGILKEQNASNLDLLITIGRRMSLLLNDLMDLSQLRESNIQLHLSDLRIQAVASGVMDMLTFLVDDKPITITIDIPETFPRIVSDEKRLIQILFNLVQNAVKYTTEGSVRLHADVQNGYACIHITDTGIGMDEKTLERVFQRYEQGDSSMTAISSGIGLGLSISKQLVELHGGTLSAVSSPGAGSTFTFTMPLAETSLDGVNIEVKEQSPIAGNIPTEVSSLYKTESLIQQSVATIQRPNILAVDDDPVNLRILTSIFSEDKYEIVTVTSGRQALEQLDMRSWDLVIADVMMPQMSGYELTQMIRERFTIAELPVLLLTARSQSEDIYTGFTSGANDYVSKPMNALELMGRVHALIHLKQSVNERLRIEAAYLQAQIQPHFLFNALNSISALASFDTERMGKLIDAFSAYLRLSFSFMNAEPIIPIEHELELVQAYLFIEKERFDDRMDVIWDVDENLNVQLPPLTIQPLVENAVRHGILSRSKGGTVHITIKGKPEYTEITISDNGKGMDANQLKHLFDSPANVSGGIGFLNTHKRLLRRYGKGLQLLSTPGQGTMVSFIIPASNNPY